MIRKVIKMNSIIVKRLKSMYERINTGQAITGKSKFSKDIKSLPISLITDRLGFLPYGWRGPADPPVATGSSSF